MGLGLRAAGRGEENNRRGGREREGRREAGTRGPPPVRPGLARQGPQFGVLWALEVRGETSVPRPGRSPAPPPSRASWDATRGRVILGDSAPRALFPSVTRTSRHQPRSGWASRAPSSPPLLTLPVRPPASDPPSPPASSVRPQPRDVRVGGREKVSGLRSFPRSPHPLAPALRLSPRTTHQIEAALH